MLRISRNNFFLEIPCFHMKSDITLLLEQVRNGNPDAMGSLFNEIYDCLRQMAGNIMRGSFQKTEKIVR